MLRRRFLGGLLGKGFGRPNCSGHRGANHGVPDEKGSPIDILWEVGFRGDRTTATCGWRGRTTADRMAAHRRLDRRRNYLSGAGLRYSCIDRPAISFWRPGPM